MGMKGQLKAMFILL